MSPYLVAAHTDSWYDFLVIRNAHQLNINSMNAASSQYDVRNVVDTTISQQSSVIKKCSFVRPSTKHAALHTLQSAWPSSTILSENKKLSYRTGTTWRAVFANLCYISRVWELIKVSNSKSDLATMSLSCTFPRYYHLFPKIQQVTWL